MINWNSLKQFFLLVIFLFFIVTSIESKAATLGQGDLNNDLIVDLHDAIIALQLVTKQNVAIFGDINCDVDWNRLVGLEEAIYALQAAAGLRETPALWTSFSGSIGYGETYADYHSDSIRQTSDNGFVFVYETINGGAGRRLYLNGRYTVVWGRRA